MKRVVIVPHGKAVPYGYEDDFTRDLRDRGKNDAELVSQELKKQNVIPDEIKEVIKPFNYDKEVLKEMNKSKIVSPLIIVDPVQKERNAAAALNKEKFELFKIICKRFLKEKSPDYFEMKEVSIEDLKKKLEAVENENLTDPLTGIANRKKFDVTLLEQSQRCKETGDKMCLVLSDIDFFKKFL